MNRSFDKLVMSIFTTELNTRAFSRNLNVDEGWTVLQSMGLLNLLAAANMD